MEKSVSGKDQVVDMIMGLKGLRSLKDIQLFGHLRIISVELQHPK